MRWREISNLDSGKEYCLVLHLEHSIDSTRVIALLPTNVSDLEAELRYEFLYLLPRQFDLDFMELFCVMPLQWTDIDPKASWLKYFVDCLHVVKNIVSCVDEEASD